MEEIKETKIKLTDRRKKIAISFLDLFLVFVFELLIFYICEIIFINTNHYNKTLSNMSTKQNELVEICKQTKLTYDIDIDGKTELSSPDYVVNEYVISLTYTSLKSYNSNNTKDKVFEKAYSISSNNDPCFYYYNTFVKENINSFKESNNQILTIEGYKKKYLSLINNEKKNYFTDDDYPLLKENVANNLYSYLASSEKGTNEIYDTISGAYYSLLTEAIDSFLVHYTPYIDAQENFDCATNNFYKNHLIILLICYVVSVILFYLVVPLLTKGKTLFMILFKTEYVTTQYEHLAFQDLFIRFLVILISFLILNAFVCIAVLGYEQGVMVLFNSFLKVLCLALLCLFDFIFILCSFIFTFYKKDKKQFFSEFFSNVIMIEKQN